MHVKDEIKTKSQEHGGHESTILGTGLIGVKEVLDWGRTSGGAVHFIIEQKSYQGKSPLECVKI